MESKDFFPDSELFRFSDFHGCSWNGSSFLTYANSVGYLEKAKRNPGVVAILVPSELIDHCRGSQKVFITTDNPRSAFFDAFVNAIENFEYGVKIAHFISDTAIIEDHTIIEPGIHVGSNVKIGKNCLIKSGTFIEDDVTIHDNVTLGSEGLQSYVSSQDGRLKNVKHAGGVWIEKGCTLLQGVNVSKSLFNGYTRIGQESILSIGVSIGHGCVLGKRVQVSGGSLVGGSCSVGDNVWIGPRSLISDGLTIESAAKIRLGSVVIENVPLNGDVSGNFAFTHSSRMREFSVARRKGK